MIVYISDFQNSNKELLIQINAFNKVTGYERNSRKISALLYTNAKWAKKEKQHLSQ